MENHNTKLDIEVATNNKDSNQPKNDLEDPYKEPQVRVGDSPRLADDFKHPPKAPSKPKDTQSPLTITSKTTASVEKQNNMVDSLKLADHTQHNETIAPHTIKPENNRKARNRKKKEKRKQKKQARVRIWFDCM